MIVADTLGEGSAPMSRHIGNGHRAVNAGNGADAHWIMKAEVLNEWIHLNKDGGEENNDMSGCNISRPDSRG